MVIILLNFLISIVSKAHDEAINIQLETTYNQKCELNYEYDAIVKNFSFLFKDVKEGDIFVIAATFNEQDDEKEQHEEEMVAIKRLEKDLKDGFMNMQLQRSHMMREIRDKAEKDKKEVLGEI